MCNLIVSQRCTNQQPPPLPFLMTFCSQMKIFPFSFSPLLIFLHTHIEFNIINMILIIITALTHLHYKMKNISCLASLCSIMPPPPAAAASVNLTYNHQSRVEYSLPMYKFYMLTSSLIVSYVYRFFYCSMSCLYHKFPFLLLLLFLVFLLFLHW